MRNNETMDAAVEKSLSVMNGGTACVAGCGTGLALRRHSTRVARGLSSRHPQVNAGVLALIATLTLTLSLPIAAQQTTTAPAGIAPMLEEETAAVVVVDLDKIDLKALDEYAGKLLDKSYPSEPSKEVKKFIDAKASKIILSLSLMDIPQAGVPIAVLPKAGADPEPLRKLLTKMTQDNPRYSHEAKQIGDLLVMAPAATLKRISKNTAKRPDLEKALAAGEDAAVKIVFALPESTKATIAELMPTLPPELGGGDSSALSEGLQWGVITIQPPPKVSAKGLAQANDKESAAKLKDLWLQLIKVVAQESKITPRRIDKETFEKLLAIITPQVKDNQLTIEISPEQAEFAFQKLLVPFFHYEIVWRERSSRLKNLDMMVLIYANENRNQWPDNLGVLLKDGHVKKEDLRNPVRPDLEVGYILVKPAVPLDKLKDPSQTILIYEAYKQWGEGIFVALADGHVEFMPDQKQFESMLKQSTTAPTTAPAK